MKIRMLVKFKTDPLDSAWTEIVEDEIKGDPRLYAQQIIDDFNDTLRPGERPRQLLTVRVLDETGIKNHNWSKTNLVTIHKGGQYYDTCKCERCGVTGRRYGLGEHVVLDRKYKAKKYQRCDTSQE